MSADENKAVVTRVIEEILNQGHVTLVDDLFAPSYIFTPLWPDPRRPSSVPTTEGPAGLKAGLAMLRPALPDMQVTIEAMVAEADTVMVCTTTRGTHTGGPFFDLPPSGKALQWTSFSIYRLDTGKIVEERGLWDRLGTFQQLGVLPSQDALQQQMRAAQT